MKNIHQKDIADALGISLNTVSRALRDCPDIGEKTKKTVRDKANELGYIPNFISSFLASGRIRMISIVVYNLKNIYFALMADSLIRHFSRLGYQCLLSACEKEKVGLEDVKLILASQCMGIISLIEMDNKAVKLCAKRGVPVCLIGRTANQANISSFDSDDYQGGTLLAKEYIKGGFLRPCYLEPTIKGAVKRRLQGFRETLAKEGVRVRVYTHVYGKGMYAYFANQIRKNKNDFVFSYNDEIAINVKRQLNNRSIIFYGFDGISERLSIISSINGLAVKWDEVVEDACSDLLRRMKDEKEARVTIHKFYPMHLVENPSKKLN